MIKLLRLPKAIHPSKVSSLKFFSCNQNKDSWGSGDKSWNSKGPDSSFKGKKCYDYNKEKSNNDWNQNVGWGNDTSNNKSDGQKKP